MNEPVPLLIGVGIPLRLGWALKGCLPIHHLLPGLDPSFLCEPRGVLCASASVTVQEGIVLIPLLLSP